MREPHEYDPDCRCPNCCRQKFGRLPRDVFGRVPVQRLCNHFLYDARCEVAKP